MKRIDLLRVVSPVASLVLAALLASAASCKQENDVPAPTRTDVITSSDRPTILFLGDSLTAGRGLAPSEAAPALIQAKVDAAGLDYNVVNGGRSGDTTAGGLARLGWYLRPELKLSRVVIGLGSNDAMRGLPVDEMEKNLRAIVRKIRAFDPEIKIFLYQMHIFPSMGQDYAGAYEKLFARVAKSENVVLLPFPLLEVGGRPELNQSDGIHPTAEGTVIMADSIWKNLKDHL